MGEIGGGGCAYNEDNNATQHHTTPPHKGLTDEANVVECDPNPNRQVFSPH